jgi:hypothetical protein
MNNTDELYNVRGLFISFISEKINAGVNAYINKHKADIRYFLHYPLVEIELGLDMEPAESIENGILRDSFGFLVQKTLSKWNEFEHKPIISKKGFESYTTKSSGVIQSIWHDNYTLMDVKDGNSYAKSIINKIDNNRYKLITSLVSNTYREESFYFYGADDAEEQEKEKQFILQNTLRFFKKYFIQIKKIDNLYSNFDQDILSYCKDKVMIDLSKLHHKTKSSIFNSLDELGSVLSFLYYLAFVKNLKRKLALMIDNEDKHLDECLLQFPKEWIVNTIANLFKIPINRVNRIISYLTNTGNSNILEFPLFEHRGMIITAPSLIVINDWSFTIVNGHYIKNISFIKREKTISVSTEIKLEKALKSVTNVLYCKEKYYEVWDQSGEKYSSDIDFAIFDYSNNILFVIESKWKDNHYYNGEEKNHPKIQDTFNKIFKEQVKKHKLFLSANKNISSIFDFDIRIDLQHKKADIYYVAIDKRNQLHLNNDHMITEYMLLFLIKQNINNNMLSLLNVVDAIHQMHTKVEYISINPTFEISLNSDIVIEVDNADLTLEYNIK